MVQLKEWIITLLHSQKKLLRKGYLSSHLYLVRNSSKVRAAVTTITILPCRVINRIKGHSLHYSIKTDLNKVNPLTETIIMSQLKAV